MVDYGRDLDIGRPRAETSNVDVQNFSTVISAIDTTNGELEEATEELKKIRIGTGLILGQEIEEAD